MMTNRYARLVSKIIRLNFDVSPKLSLLERSEYCSVSSSVFHQSATFKSDIIDKLYPGSSNPDFLKENSSSKQNETENFSGYIPVDELEIKTSKSSGPGGQNVNKVNSKVDVRFHLNSASWIPDWIKPRLAAQEDSRITKDGFLVIKSDMTRKQLLNQADCMNKLRKMIFSASYLPKEPTEDEVKLKEARVARAKAGVLREKRNRSLVKKSRSIPEL